MQSWAGNVSLRYSLVALSPGFFWAAWHAWRASRTVASDAAIYTEDSRSEAQRPGMPA
jgi:hypothetical protein